MDLSFITQLWEQVIKSPVWIVIALVLNVLVFLWRKSDRTDNRWIPRICVLGGMLLYWALGPMDTIAKEQRHPWVLMLLFGALLGFGSWAAHGLLIKAIRLKFPGFLEDEAPAQNKTKAGETPSQQSGDSKP